MDNQMISILVRIGTYLVMLLIAGAGGLLAFNLAKKGDNAAKKAVSNIDTRLKEKGELSDKKLELSQLGIMYRFNDYNLNPSKYMVLRVAVGLLLTLIAFVLGAKVLSLLGLPLGYLLTNLVFRKLNDRDNDDMAKDVYNTYANLKIQLSSGIYLGDCLEYTYDVARNKRYKEALKELVLNFSDKSMTSAEAIEIFKNRFQSKQINKLCAMMNTFVQYGISEAYVNDIMIELQSVLAADTLKAEHDIESKTGMITFGFFGLIIALVAIAMAQSFSGMSFF